MIQIMQQLQIGNQSLGQAIGQQQEQLNQQRDASHQQMQRLEMMMTNISQRGSGVVDVRQVGKPDFLKGSKDQIGKQWPDWMYTFETWFCSQFRDAEKALRWAREVGSASITETDIAQQGSDAQWPELGKINAQLQVALVSLCRDEALTVVRNSERGQGLDAWRRLNREYEPNNPQANLRLLKKVLQPAQQSIDTLRASIETWEREYRMYRDRSGEVLSDAIQRLTLQSMAPPSLQEHLDFHAGRLVTYTLLKAEIDAYLDVKLSAQAGGATPMDVDALKGKKGQYGKGGGKHGKGGGKYDNNVPPCRHCGGRIAGSHTEWDCWHNPRNMAPEAVAKREGKAKGKGSTAKGKKPKGKGKNGKQGKGAHALEGEDYPGDELAEGAPDGRTDVGTLG